MTFCSSAPNKPLTYIPLQAQIHLVKALALTAGSQKIRVNSVSPGLLLTVSFKPAPKNASKLAHKLLGMGPAIPPVQIDAATNKSSLKRLAAIEVRLSNRLQRRFIDTNCQGCRPTNCLPCK